MSYEIIYRRLYIKFNNDDNKTVPFILTGSNNSYEADRPKRRSRSWYPYTNNGQLFLVKGDFEKQIDEYFKRIVDSEIKYRKDNGELITEKDVADEISARFGSHTSEVIIGLKYYTFKQYKDYFLNGYKNTFDYDFLKQHGLKLKAWVSKYILEQFPNIPDIFKKVQDIESLEDYISILATMKLLTGSSDNISIYFNEYDVDYFFKKIKRLASKDTIIKKVIKTQPYYFVLLNNSGKIFFYDKTKYGYRTSAYKDNAKAFKTERQAQKYLEKFRISDYFTIVRVNEKRDFVKKIKTKELPLLDVV